MHLATELLLQFPNEPNVDLPEGLAQAVGDVDHHSLPVAGYIYLAAKPQSPPHVSTAQGYLNPHLTGGRAGDTLDMNRELLTLHC
jgi:hypothetical protein